MKKIAGLLFFIILLAGTSCKQKAETGITEIEAKALLDSAIKAYIGGESLNFKVLVADTEILTFRS
jgi:hypothetical protein